MGKKSRRTKLKQKLIERGSKPLEQPLEQLPLLYGKARKLALKEAYQLELVNQGNVKAEQALSRSNNEMAYKLANETIVKTFHIQTSTPHSSMMKNQVLGNAYYNLAMSIIDSDTNKAIKSLKQAKKMMPEDQDVIYWLCFCYINLNQTTEAQQIAKLLHPGVAQALTVQSNILRSSKEELQRYKKILEGNLQTAELQQKGYPSMFWSSTYESLSSVYIELGDFKNAINCAYKLETFERRGEPSIIARINRILNVFCKLQQFADGLKFLEQQYQEHPFLLKSKKTVDFLYKEFILYEMSASDNPRAEEILTDLNMLASQFSPGALAINLVSAANYLRFYNCVSNSKFTEAEKLIELIPINKVYAKQLISQLKADLARVKSGDNVSVIEKASENYLLISNAIIDSELSLPASEKVSSSISDETEIYLSPQAIHSYFQHKKALLARAASDALQMQQNVTKIPAWTVSDALSFSATDNNIYKLANKDGYYVYLPEKLCKSLKQADCFVNAITSKGITHKKFGCNGLKFCKGVVEIKTKGDDRAWGNKIYVNDTDNHLIIIDALGNHAAAKKAIQKSAPYIQMISVSSELPSRYSEYKESKALSHTLDSFSFGQDNNESSEVEISGESE